MKYEKCETHIIHQEVIDQIQSEPLDFKNLDTLAVFFKVLGDQTRLKIIRVLLKSECCVCDIAYLLNMSQSLISHQLKVLKKARLVKSRRDGKIVYYSLNDEHIVDIFNYGLIHVSERSDLDE